MAPELKLVVVVQLCAFGLRQVVSDICQMASHIPDIKSRCHVLPFSHLLSKGHLKVYLTRTKIQHWLFDNHSIVNDSHTYFDIHRVTKKI